MCLMQTDLPVPDGPRIIEILSSGRPMFSPRSTWLRAEGLVHVDELDRVRRLAWAGSSPRVELELARRSLAAADARRDVARSAAIALSRRSARAGWRPRRSVCRACR